MSGQNSTQVIIHEDADQSVEVRLDLTQRQMADLFDKDVRTINEHIGNVYADEELTREPTIRKFRIVGQEGTRRVTREIEHYDLDVIISVSYRVKSQRGV